FASTLCHLAQSAGGVGEDRIDLAGVRQQIGAPLRPVAVVLADLRQQALELLHIARDRLAELRFGTIAAPDFVERLLPSLRVEAPRNGGGIAATPAIPGFGGGRAVDEARDALGQSIQRLRRARRGGAGLLARG